MSIVSPSTARTEDEQYRVGLANAMALNQLSAQMKYAEWVSNFAKNLPRMWRDMDVSEMAKSSGAAIVIGAGPSLRKFKHLAQLAKSKNSGPIFCTDKVLRNAQEENIRVSYALNVDSSDKCLDFLMDADTTIPLIAAGTVNPKFVEAWKGEVYWFVPDIGLCGNHKDNVADTLSIMSGKTVISTGGNNGTTAILAAHIVGSRPIGLIGMDMAYDADAPIEGTDYWNPLFEAYGERAREFYARRTNPFWKNEYVTDHVFDAYRALFLERVRLLGLDIVNCSGQGALHGGDIRQMLFAEFLEKYG